jgi:hypothetical protein
MLIDEDLEQRIAELVKSVPADHSIVIVARRDGSPLPHVRSTADARDYVNIAGLLDVCGDPVFAAAGRNLALYLETQGKMKL